MPRDTRNIDDANERDRGDEARAAAGAEDRTEDRNQGRNDVRNRDRNEDRDEGRRGASPVQTPGIHGETAPASHHDQHTRKGQAQSPRELTHNEQPKKKEGHR